MLAFWFDVLRPMLDDLRPRSIVEIGSESGKLTRRLLELAGTHDAHVHAIDPQPRFDVAAAEREAAGMLTVHEGMSLDVIPTLNRLDAVLIDGDHNWYTVFHELVAIEKRARQLGQITPMMVIHDVCWPYGRRDLYYDPDTIPEEHRQPWARRGISPTEKRLVEVGGYNPHLCHALEEGGPRNGVWTAVEDYLESSEVPFVVAKIPAVFGLAILLPSERAEERPRLAERMAAWSVPEIVSFIDRMETARIAMMMGITAVPR